MKFTAIKNYLYAAAESDLMWSFEKKHIFREPGVDDFDDSFFRIGSIRNRCIRYFILCLFLAGFISPVFWYAPSRIAFQMPEYYLGVGLSAVLAAGSYFSVQHVRNYFVHRSSDLIKNLRKAYYVSMAGYLIALTFLLALLLFLVDIPFVYFPLYSLFFSCFFALIVMKNYLSMRIRDKYYLMDTSVIDEVKRLLK